MSYSEVNIHIMFCPKIATFDIQECKRQQVSKCSINLEFSRCVLLEQLCTIIVSISHTFSGYLSLIDAQKALVVLALTAHRKYCHDQWTSALTLIETLKR